MLLGAHCTATAGNNFGIDKATELGCRSMQIFGSNKLQWKAKTYSDGEVKAFRQARAKSGLGPVFSHAIYLINLGAKAANPDVYERSIASLAEGLRICDVLGLDGLIAHAGSNYGLGIDGVLDSITEGLLRVREDSRSETPLLLENTAGSEKLVGGRFLDFAAIFDALGNDPRLRVCVDTAHAFAFGYDLAAAAGLRRMINEIDGAVGLERIGAMHINDSKVPCGRNLDRHENLGQGNIGYAGLGRVLRHPKLAGIPAILETPGFDGQGPDLGNMEIMRALAGELAVDPEVLAKRAKHRAARGRRPARASRLPEVVGKKERVG